MFTEADLESDLSEKRYLDALRKIERLDKDPSRRDYFNYLRAHVCRMLGALDQAADICRSGRLAATSEFTYLEECFACAFHAEDWDLLAEAFNSILEIGALPLNIRPGLFFGALSGPQRLQATTIRDALFNVQLNDQTSQAQKGEIAQDWLTLDTPSTWNFGLRHDQPRVAILVHEDALSEHLYALVEQFEYVEPNTERVGFHHRSGGGSELLSALREFDPDLVIVQQPYLEKFPTSFVESEFLDRTVNFGYGPMLAGNDYFFGRSAGQFGFSGYIRGGLTLVHHGSFREKFLRAGVHESRLLNAGDPLTWKLRAELRDSSAGTTFESDLLWAPHWTSRTWTGNKLGYSNATRDLEVVLNLAASGVLVKVRPHPLLIQIHLNDLQIDLNRHQDVFSLEFEEKWREFVSLPNVSVSDDSMLHDVLTARTMLTDGVSIIHYWALTGKPIAVSRNARSPGFAQQGDGMLSRCAMTWNAYDVERWFENAISSTELDFELIEGTFDLVSDFGDSPGAILSRYLRR
jgi:hypothetical protein